MNAATEAARAPGTPGAVGAIGAEGLHGAAVGPRAPAGPARAHPRILYYCQSLVGIGHLAASRRVAEELAKHADVDLIHGGLDAGHGPAAERLRCLRLPTLLHDPLSHGLVDPGDEPARDSGQASAFAPGAAGEADAQRPDLAAVWAARAEAIAGFLRWPYHAVVLEFWPFGRRRFKGEIMALLDAVRARCGSVPVFTSVREILLPRPLEAQCRMVASVHKHIHTVFVRSDPAVARLHDSFPLAHEIEDRLCHTGYIAPAFAALDHAAGPRRPQVLVSQGGGQVGAELLAAVIGAAALVPRLHFMLVAGARATRSELDALRAQVRSANVEVTPFLDNFAQQLSRSALSINMGGDNTLLDLVATRTPSLAYPYQGNVEQGLRIARFAARGFVHPIGPHDLAAARLVAAIERALVAPYPKATIAMDGARVTSERILEATPAFVPARPR